MKRDTVSGLALSVIATRCQLPKVGALGSPHKLHLFAKASPKGRGLGKEMKFVWTAKGSHFGGAGIEQSEMTERARMLPLYNNFFLCKRAASSAIVALSMIPTKNRRKNWMVILKEIQHKTVKL